MGARERAGRFPRYTLARIRAWSSPEGRRAKATVLLCCVLDDGWRGRDEETEYPERLARNLLIEFVGGELAAQLRDQFA